MAATEWRGCPKCGRRLGCHGARSARGRQLQRADLDPVQELLNLVGLAVPDAREELLTAACPAGFQRSHGGSPRHRWLGQCLAAAQQRRCRGTRPVGSSGGRRDAALCPSDCPGLETGHTDLPRLDRRARPASNATRFPVTALEPAGRSGRSVVAVVVAVHGRPLPAGVGTTRNRRVSAIRPDTRKGGCRRPMAGSSRHRDRSLGPAPRFSACGYADRATGGLMGGSRLARRWRCSRHSLRPGTGTLA